MTVSLRPKYTSLLFPRKRGSRVTERAPSAGPPLSRGKQPVGRVGTVLFFLALCLPATEHAHAQASSDQLLKRVVDEVIVPGYANLVQAAVVQQVQWQAFCVTPSADGMASARDAYHRAADAWSSIEVIHYGPISEDFRG